MEETTVRPMGPPDHDDVLALARSLPEWFNAQGLEEIARDLATQEGWVAVEGGRPVGWVVWSRQEPEGANMTWLGVEKGSQRRGIGTALVEHMAAALRARGIREVFVSTVADSVDYEPYAKTRAFYRARGFADFRVDRGYFKDPRGDYDRLLLRRPI